MHRVTGRVVFRDGSAASGHRVGAMVRGGGMIDGVYTDRDGYYPGNNDTHL